MTLELHTLRSCSISLQFPVVIYISDRCIDHIIDQLASTPAKYRVMHVIQRVKSQACRCLFRKHMFHYYLRSCQNMKLIERIIWADNMSHNKSHRCRQFRRPFQYSRNLPPNEPFSACVICALACSRSPIHPYCTSQLHVVQSQSIAFNWSQQAFTQLRLRLVNMEIIVFDLCCFAGCFFFLPPSSGVYTFRFAQTLFGVSHIQEMVNCTVRAVGQMRICCFDQIISLLLATSELCERACAVCVFATRTMKCLAQGVLAVVRPRRYIWSAFLRLGAGRLNAHEWRKILSLFFFGL